MGGIIVASALADRLERRRRVQAMAETSRYRGALRCWDFPGITFGLQARNAEATVDETDARLVLTHGRPYALGSETPSAKGAQGAVLVGRLWDAFADQCLERIDGEYSLLIYDKVAGYALVCVSLMMTRQLYVGSSAERGASWTVLASEVRQVAAGLQVVRRLDLASLVQSLCLNGPVLQPERTEYLHIDRLFAPRVYRLAADGRPPRVVSSYWEPPALAALSEIERASLPEQVVARLRGALRAAPRPSALTLSGGYDSGTLWAVAYSDRDGYPMPESVSMSFSGSHADETAIISALLRLTGRSGRFVDAGRLLGAKEEVALDPSRVDRIPLIMGLTMVDHTASSIRSAGLHDQILGIGAEASLTGYGYFIGDQLRQWQLLGALRDLFQFESYYLPNSGLVGRLRMALTHGIAPHGTRLQFLRRNRLAVPLAPEWLPLYGEAQRALYADTRESGPARGIQLEQMRFYTLTTGIETHEQLNEQSGVEMHMPFLHRGVMELGMTSGLRNLACGRHEKELLRHAACSALGVEPPWPRKKVYGDAGGADQALLRLGPVGDWWLVQSGVLEDGGAMDLLRRASAGSAPIWTCGRIVAFERFCRSLNA